MYKQWTTDGTKYFPAGEVVKNLPPNYYEIKESMQGLYFDTKPIKTQKLIRFPDAASDKVIREIDKFWNLEESFRNSDIPYKRGMLLYGPPGSGKTCTLRIVVENLIKERNGIVVDFSSVHLFKEGYEILRRIHKDMPIIIMMEDIEAILRRTSESEVLNLLDGMYGIDKAVFLATTNYPEQLGSRIMNRPSRFDKKIFIGMPSSEAREIFIRGKLIDEDEDVINKWVEDTDGMSIAHIHELYVANRILNDSYEEAIGVLKMMVVTPGSDTFDPHRVVSSIDESNDIPSYYAAKEESYDRFGSGDVYLEAKKIYRKGGVISEGVTKKNGVISKRNMAPHRIAELLSEDIYNNNGLV